MKWQRQRRSTRTEEEIEGDVQDTIVDDQTRENGDDTIHVNGHSLQDVLVEHVGDGVRVATVRLSAMEKEEVTKESELANCVV